MHQAVFQTLLIWGWINRQILCHQRAHILVRDTDHTQFLNIVNKKISNITSDKTVEKKAQSTYAYSIYARWMCGWMGGWCDGWMDRQTDGRMNGWMDGWIHIEGLWKHLEIITMREKSPSNSAQTCCYQPTTDQDALLCPLPLFQSLLWL